MDASTVIARSMSERDLSQHVVNLARMLGWLVHRDPTWRATGTDPGYPDLTLCRRGEVIWAELKAMGGRTSDAQTRWLDELPADDDTITVCIWTPLHWINGTIERVLRGEG